MILENLFPQKINHDLGMFADEDAINLHYPTGRPGDYLKNADTATYWNWNGEEWADTGIAISQMDQTISIVNLVGNGGKNYTVPTLEDADTVMVFVNGQINVPAVDYNRPAGGGQISFVFDVFTDSPIVIIIIKAA